MPSAYLDPSRYEPTQKVKNLSEVGSAVEIDRNVPLKRYFRSGREMLRMADVYHKEGNIENAFILLTKYITLFVEKIRKHPEFKEASQADWEFSKKKLKEVFPVAEDLKSQLLTKYTEEYNFILKEKKRQEEEFAQKEEQRRREEEARRLFQLHKQKILGQEKLNEPPKDPVPLCRPVVTPSDIYPRILDGENYSRANTPLMSLPESDGVVLDSSTGTTPEIPSRSSKPSYLSSTESPTLRVIPPVDRSTKPLPLLSPEPYFTGMEGMRSVIVPSGIFGSFLRLAQGNTNKNVETCGILAGKFSRNQLIITHLLVPKQTGTSDSCFTESEEEVLEYQDKYNLDTIGWIHTHPSQTAFMSSVDLHTHCSYQLMLPEAIAIVCSPKYQENGIFSLTMDYGLAFISNCQSTGFHPHPKEPALYEESKHIKIDDTATTTVVDLRR